MYMHFICFNIKFTNEREKIAKNVYKSKNNIKIYAVMLHLYFFATSQEKEEERRKNKFLDYILLFITIELKMIVYQIAF